MLMCDIYWQPRRATFQTMKGIFILDHIICKANRAIICPLFRIVHYTCMRVLFCSLILRNDFKLLNIYEITLVSRFNALVNRQCALWGIVRIKAWKKVLKKPLCYNIIKEKQWLGASYIRRILKVTSIEKGMLCCAVYCINKFVFRILLYLYS